MRSFPFLTDEEANLLAGYLRDSLSPDEQRDFESLKLSASPFESITASLRQEFDVWRRRGRNREFSRLVFDRLRKQRHVEKLRLAWKRLESLAGRVREEYEIVLEAFIPSAFDNTSRFLGEGEAREFEIARVVRPFLGKAWEIDGFSVTIPAKGEDAEFEVKDPEGGVVMNLRMGAGEKADIPFAKIGMDQGGIWSWCLSYFVDGGISVCNGRVSVLDPSERTRIEHLLSFAEREASEAGASLMKALVLMEFDCFDGAIRVLDESLGKFKDPGFQREALLLLHRTYTQVRNEYLSLGLQEESNDVLNAIFSVENALGKLSEVEETE